MSLPSSQPTDSAADGLSAYDYELPPELIAQEPLAVRDAARLLVVDRRQQSLVHASVADLPDLLSPGDVVVLNDSKVIPARLIGRRAKTGGQWEGLFLGLLENGQWQFLSRSRGKLQPGESLTLVGPEGDVEQAIELVEPRPGGVWIGKTPGNESAMTILDRVGWVPLPPYIRQGRMQASDRERYQTIYAERPGAVAAPTAGLHLSHELFARFAAASIDVCRVTLHVGLGTFRPITAATLAEHQMHAEWGTLPTDVAERLSACRAAGKRIIAIGTTSVRVLETAAAVTGGLSPWEGWTDLFIRPPYSFRNVDVLFTNFHFPRSTLLVLIHAFAGSELAARAYQLAIQERYRFYSYGDAMLIL